MTGASRRASKQAVVVYVVFTLSAVVVGCLVADAIGRALDFQAIWILTLVGLGLVTAAIVRVARVSAVVDHRGVTVRNPYRTILLPWEVITEVSAGRSGPIGPFLNGNADVIVVASRRYGRLPITASYLAGADSTFRDALVSEARAHRVPVISID